MAASARALSRAARASLSPINHARPSLRSLPRQSLYLSSRRGYADASEAPKSTPPPPPPSGGGSGLIWGLGLAALGGAGYYFYSQQGADTGKSGNGVAKKYPPGFQPKFDDYQEVYNVVAKKLQDETDYDDGSYGPVLLRLGWHASGTYDAATGTGGSNGATMRFAPESDHGANAGLLAARDFLAPVKEQFPWITYSDLWTLSAVAAIQEMQGPVVPWRPGRADRDESWCTPDGRLPDGAKEQKHLRAIFGRMGFNDQEIVALSGAHALGRCHTDRSGFEGPWTFSPTVLTNDYYKLLLQEKWNWRNWNGPKQYEDTTSKTLMMLPTDMALIKDRSFKKHVERYANDNEVFFKEFGDVITKLFELGVPFQSAAESRFRFKTLE